MQGYINMKRQPTSSTLSSDSSNITIIYTLYSLIVITLYWSERSRVTPSEHTPSARIVLSSDSNDPLEVGVKDIIGIHTI